MRDYSIIFISLCQYLIPSFLRQSKIIVFLKVMLSSLQNMNDDFVLFVKSKQYEMSITGQVIYLEKLLNDEFDNNLRRIYIEDAVTVDSLFLRYENEQRDTFMMRYESENVTTDNIRYESEYIDAVSFVVFIPADVTNLTLLKALVNKYRAASKLFDVQYI